MVAEIDLIQGDLDMLARIERHQSQHPAPIPTPAVIKSESKDERRARLDTAYRSLFKYGHNPARAEQRDIITSDSDGSAVIPQEYSGIIEAQRFYGPIATLVTRKDSDTGRSQKWTISDDTAATMTYLPETGSTSALEEDPTLESKIPGADTLLTTVKYSLQELEDSENFDEFLRGIAGLRVSRAIEYALTLGKDNGSNTALPSSPTNGLLGNVVQGAVTANLAAGIGYSDLVALAGSVDHAYYVKGAYMGSPSVHNYFLAQKDSTSRPYYNVDPDTGLLMINGKPLYVNNAMPAYNTASSPVVLFGDFSRAYAYLNGGGMKVRILSERYIDTLEQAAIIYTRVGAATLVSGAVKSLVTASA